MSGNRSTQAELAQRRKEIQLLMIEGHDKDFIVDRMVEKWKVSARSIKEDIRQIGRDWKERAPEDMQQMRNKYNDRLELMFEKAFGLGRLKEALAIQKEINALNNVYGKNEDQKDEIPKIIEVGRRSPLKVVPGEDE